MTILSIIALCIFVFGAYAYGSVVLLSLRHGSVVWAQDTDAQAHQTRVPRYSLAMFVICTIWLRARISDAPRARPRSAVGPRAAPAVAR